MVLSVVPGVEVPQSQALAQGSPSISSTAWSPGPCEDSCGSSTPGGRTRTCPPPFSHICQGTLPSRGPADRLAVVIRHARQAPSDLGDDVTSEHRVPVCFMRQVGGQEVDEPLNLVYHGVHVGHLQPVLDGRDAAWPDHPVDFFVEFLCRDMKRTDAKDPLRAGSHPPTAQQRLTGHPQQCLGVSWMLGTLG